MATEAFLIVNVDSDPDPVSSYQEDASVLAKYERMREIMRTHANGAAAWTILTGSLYRDRFYEQPFIDFWSSVLADGGDLVLHPEEDLYGPGPGTGPDTCSYYCVDHMRDVILSRASKMKAAGLPVAAYRGGYHGFTPEIGEILKLAGIEIELSCAPGIVWPEKAASWGDAPRSAYYMSPSQQSVVAEPGDADALFEIPWAWDEVAPGTSRRFVVGENYMINEFSNLDAMKRVWDAVVDRSSRLQERQIVSMVCHTYTMGKPEFEERLMSILDYVSAQQGQIVSPTRAKAIFDESRASQSD
ncbi:hypothetical protein [Brucella intermedia]|uniref:hypothetical protein n=1 Tax=Brucella intermedia TaxID=94625 RepID=UPI002248E113|nr:hypothetical protein [Brucella intermedia]